MAFTRVAACLFAEPPKVARFLEGFDGFVASTAAPIATGWSDQLSGRESHPLKIRAFSRRTAIGTPTQASTFPGTVERIKDALDLHSLEHAIIDEHSGVIAMNHQELS